MARGHDYTPDPAERDSEPASRKPSPERSPDQEIADQRGRGGGQGSAPTQPSTPDIRPLDAERTRSERHPYREIDRDRTLMLRESEIRALAEVGAFRAVTAHDLTRFRYGGDHRQAWRDLNNLARQGLIRRRTAYPGQQVYVTLTRQGHRFVEAHRPRGMDAKQVLYRGFVKPREAKHDATLYRLYQRAADEIERKGGKVQRVVLDFELKKSINTKLAKAATLPESQQPQRKQKIAKEHGLAVVDGKIPLPDLRIEYETAARDQTRVDLELVTSDYHRDSLAEKTRAGFAIFALREDATPLRRAIGDPELTRDIFSL